jgi:RNA polymerase sigma factor (sigma-70 family)
MSPSKRDKRKSVKLTSSVENYPGPGLDPVAICTRIGGGDPGAEAEFVAHFQRRIRVFLAGRTQDRQLAEELCQDIMIALLCALRDGRLREPEMLSSFVYGVARNRLNDYFRKRTREKLDAFPEGFEVAAPAVDHEEQQRYHMVEREIERLDRDDRKILSMTLIDGLKPGEIGASLRLSSEVVRQRKSRALKKLANRLGFGSQSGDSLPLTQVRK